MIKEAYAEYMRRRAVDKGLGFCPNCGRPLVFDIGDWEFVPHKNSGTERLLGIKCGITWPLCQGFKKPLEEMSKKQIKVAREMLERAIAAYLEREHGIDRPIGHPSEYIHCRYGPSDNW